MLKTPAKKAGGIPSITFSNPSLVTTTTHWVVDASYRVFLLEGTDLSNNSQLQVDATLNNWSSNINIYFLVVGAGGPGGKKNGYGGGGGGGGGFLDGSANIPGTPGIKTMSFLLPSKNELGSLWLYSKDAEITVKNNAATITYLYAAAGGGGRGGVYQTHSGASGNIPSGTGGVTKTKQGNGGGGAQVTNNSDDEYRYSGSALNRGGNGNGPYYGYGGPGGGSGGGVPFSSDNTPGIGSSVSSTTLGIKQRFGDAIFCAGGKGTAAGNTLGANYNGVDGTGIYGSGGGGSNSSNYKSGQKGIIAIAISVNDVPPEIII